MIINLASSFWIWPQYMGIESILSIEAHGEGAHRSLSLSLSCSSLKFISSPVPWMVRIENQVNGLKSQGSLYHHGWSFEKSPDRRSSANQVPFCWRYTSGFGAATIIWSCPRHGGMAFTTHQWSQKRTNQWLHALVVHHCRLFLDHECLLACLLWYAIWPQTDESSHLVLWPSFWYNSFLFRW